MKQAYKIEILQEDASYLDITSSIHSFDVAKKLQKNEVFARFEAGNIQFLNTAYDFILQTFDYQTNPTIRFSLNSVVQFSGELNLLGKWDSLKKIVNCDVKVTDEYINLLDSKDQEINILNQTESSPIDVRVKTLVAQTETSILDIRNDGIAWSTPASVTYTIWYTDATTTTVYYAREKKTLNTQQADELISSSGWALLTDNGTTKTIVRDWSDGDYNPSVAPSVSIYSPNNASPSGLAAGDLIEDGVYQFMESYYDGALYDYYGLDVNGYYNDASDKTYTRGRLLIDCVKFVVNELDSSINFEDNTAAATTDSFYYMKTYQNSESQYTLLNIWISQITDFVLDSGVEKTNAASIGNLTFDDLMHNLKRFGIYWKIENRSGSYYFVTKHLTEIAATSGQNPDLTDYFGINWSTGKGLYNFATGKIFKTLIRENTLSGNADFLGRDVVVNDLAVSNEITESYKTFFTDVWDIQNNPTTYPDNVTNQFAMVSSELKTSGSELITSWTNTTFETFTSSGSAITSAINTSGAGSCNTGVIAGFVKGDSLKFVITLTLNSGELPVLNFNSKDYTLAAGLNTIYTDVVNIAGSYNILFNNTANSDWSATCSAFKVFYYAFRSTGALSGDDVMNAALSQANIDSELLAGMPSDDVNINGSDVTLSSDRLAKIKLSEEISLPLQDFANFEFDETITTDLGALEIDSITLKCNQELAKIKGRF